MMGSRATHETGKCPVTFAMDVFGDKWSLLIVRDLLLKGKRHFGDFLQSSERISTNILADRLAKLERHGLITKERDSSSGRKVIYRATQKARDLLPILLEIIVWSAKHDPAASTDPQIIHGGPTDLVRRTMHARTQLIAEILSKLD